MAAERKPTTRKTTTRKPRAPKPVPVVGWREWVTLPDLGVPAIRAKIDTGARTAALHAFGLEVVETDQGPLARFAVHLEGHGGPGLAVVAEAAVVGFRTIRNPGGRREERPVIRTVIGIGDHRFGAEVTLTRRDEMGMPMLLGRQTVRKRFLVDPGRSYLLGTPPPDES